MKLNLNGKAVFLSGPCRGYEDYNKPLFEKAEAMLPEAMFSHGFAGDVIEDVSITVVHTHQDGVQKNLQAAFGLSQATVLLPGWARKGATIEDLIVTISADRPVFFFDPGTGDLVLMSPPDITVSETPDILSEKPE